MAYTILFTKEAKKDVQVLDRTIQKQLYKKLMYYAEIDDVQSVAKKLTNFEGGSYRLRIGNYRLIFDLEKGKTILVLRIQHRKDVYR